MDKTEFLNSIPGYASPELRSVNTPSVILPEKQVKKLLRTTEAYFKANKITIADPRRVLRDLLLELGWYNVEFQGTQLFLQAVVSHGDVPKKTINRYIKEAVKSGMWDFGHWQNINDTPQLSLIPRD